MTIKYLCIILTFLPIPVFAQLNAPTWNHRDSGIGASFIRHVEETAKNPTIHSNWYYLKQSTSEYTAPYIYETQPTFRFNTTQPSATTLRGRFVLYRRECGVETWEGTPTIEYITAVIPVTYSNAGENSFDWAFQVGQDQETDGKYVHGSSSINTLAEYDKCYEYKWEAYTCADANCNTKSSALTSSEPYAFRTPKYFWTQVDYTSQNTSGNYAVIGGVTKTTAQIKYITPVRFISFSLQYSTNADMSNPTTLPASALTGEIAFKLTGLHAGITYYYRPVVNGNDFGIKSFVTARDPGSTYKFVVIGDPHGSASWAGAKNIIDTNVKASILRENPDFIIDTGDEWRCDDLNGVPVARYTDYVMQDAAYPFSGLAQLGKPIYLVVGNHDGFYGYLREPYFEQYYHMGHNEDPSGNCNERDIPHSLLQNWSGNGDTEYAGTYEDFYIGRRLREVFPQPSVTDINSLGTTDRSARYFSFAWGDVTFIEYEQYSSMTIPKSYQNYPDPYDLDPEQYAWLQQQWNNKSTRFSILLGHSQLGGCPKFPSGRAHFYMKYLESSDMDPIVDFYNISTGTCTGPTGQMPNTGAWYAEGFRGDCIGTNSHKIYDLPGALNNSSHLYLFGHDHVYYSLMKDGVWAINVGKPVGDSSFWECRPYNNDGTYYDSNGEYHSPPPVTEITYHGDETQLLRDGGAAYVVFTVTPYQISWRFKDANGNEVTTDQLGNSYSQNNFYLSLNSTTSTTTTTKPPTPTTTTTTAVPTTTTSISGGGGGGGGGGGSKSTTTTAVNTTTTTAVPSTTTTSVNTTTTTAASSTTTTIKTECTLTVDKGFLPLRAGLFARLGRIVIKGTNSEWDKTSQVTIDDIKTLIHRVKDQETIIAWIIIPGKLIANFEPGTKTVRVQTAGKEDCTREILIE